MRVSHRGAAVIVLAGLVLAAGPTMAEVQIINPHLEPPEHCGSCHVAVPTPEQLEAEEYNLIKDSVDETCHVCHPYDCCRLYALKGHNHPSNVSKWDVEKFTEPKTLPLHNGLITCNTCHFHRKPDGPSYRMVRIIDIGLQRVDWTGLCRDCHINY